MVTMNNETKKHLFEQAIKLMNSRNLSEAKELIKQLCDMDAGDPQPWLLLSNVNGMLGHMEEVAECSRRVLAIQPHNSIANANLGYALFQAQKYDEAIAAYQRALTYDSRNINALYNMGLACQAANQMRAFVAQYRAIVEVAADASDVRTAFWHVVNNLSLLKYDSWLDSDLLAYYAQQDADYRLVSAFTAQLIKLKHDIQSPPNTDDGYLDLMLPRIGSDQLFLTMLRLAINTDSDIELLLRAIRKKLTHKYQDKTSCDTNDLKIITAIASQCLNNDYVIAFDETERQLFCGIKQRIEQSLPQLSTVSQELEQWLAIFGMYDRPLSISCGNEISKFPLESWSPILRPYVKEAILTRLEEDSIKKDIVSLKTIGDRTTQLVQSQYEENPYPRWVSLARTRKTNLGRFLKERFPHFDPPSFLDKPIKILVAGCGTGKHPIETALSFSNVEILAVDISKASLAYAIRMARKHNVQNINFMQADILDLGNLGRQFHVIECVGVLHHMKEPLAGWRILTDLLVEGGLMKVGLYSELARKPVVEVRSIIEREGLSPTRENIRNVRERILRKEFGDSVYQMSKSSFPFYSISGCRDLLFHYVEHRYTLRRLAMELSDLNLEFIGFQFDDMKMPNLYRHQFPEDHAMTNLTLWDRFEHMFPTSFGLMYRFWCKKASPSA